MTVVINGQQVEFPKKEFDLFYFLASNPEIAFTRKQLIDAAWEHEHVVDRTVDVHIKKLRTKIGDTKISHDNYKFIQTVKRTGYRLSKELDIKVDDKITKNMDAVKTDDDLIINGTYKDNKKNVVVVTNVAESKFGRLVIFVGDGFCNAIPVKDFKSVYKPT